MVRTGAFGALGDRSIRSRAANFMKYKWPTLEDRLNHPLTTELDALLQLEKTMILTEYAKKKLERLKKKNTKCLINIDGDVPHL